MITDDFDRILVGTHRAVRAKAPEFAAGRAGRRSIELLGVFRQRRKSHIIHDTNRERVFRPFLLEVSKNSRHLGRRKVFRAESITPADNQRRVSLVKKCVAHIQI